MACGAKGSELAISFRYSPVIFTSTRNLSFVGLSFFAPWRENILVVFAVSCLRLLANLFSRC